MKKTILIALALVAFNVQAQQGQIVADVANGLIPQVNSVPQVALIFSYISGIICGIKGALKLKEHSESRGQVKLSSAIILLVAAALFIAVPTYIQAGAETLGLSTNGGNSGQVNSDY